MSLNFRFAVVSDLHIALPHDLESSQSVSLGGSQYSGAGLLEHLEQQKLDFLLLPGDLTNSMVNRKTCLGTKRLSQLPFPVYVVPGNHDVPGRRWALDRFTDFPTITIGLAQPNTNLLYL